MLIVHRAERADALADALAALLGEPLPDVFAPEVVAVPTRGMERWLTQRMSLRLGATPGRADGVCAGVEFPFPHRLVGDAVAAASGVDPERDPWLPERSVWPLLEVIEEALPEPWLATLARYLGRDGGDGSAARADRRLGVVSHLASLFDRYALHRPAMLEHWRLGEDTDAEGEPLPSGCAWQAELWRRLRLRIGGPGPAERREQACERLHAEPSLSGLPARISLFGLTRLPAGHLRVLRALGTAREVHLFLLHPSVALWERVSAALGGRPAVVQRSSDPTAELPRNALLASWGRDARELEVVLGAGGLPPGAHEPSSPAPPTLLGLVQDAIRRDEAAPGEPLAGEPDARPPLDPDDRSLEIHACHGRARQVEVIRDSILHALAADPTLEPRDVIVMCPDVEVFAPLIHATFGAGETVRDEAEADALGPERSPADLRVRLADRSLRQTNPVLGVISLLLDLARERVTASQVLDLADRAPVRHRFRLDDDDLARLQDWIGDAGIRWGLDASRRARYKLDRIVEGTWQAGLQRLLLGVTMTEDGRRQFARVLPVDDVDSQSIDLVGRFAELMGRLTATLDAFTRPQPLAAWAEAIGTAADALTSAPPRERWQRAELQRILDDLVEETDGRPGAELALAEVRALLADRLAGRPTRANFRTGHLTVCTLMPMRSVPHRVVCLLGLDDGAFPRKAPRDGDDLMLTAPHLGERDPRSEDRQLLLDALLAATERLVVTYTGNDERTNERKPPAVPVGELLDTIDATVRCPEGRARDRVRIRHPLQPFDERNFRPGALGSEGPWSFDPVTLEGARALGAPRRPPTPFLSAPLPPVTGRIVELEDLIRFVEFPVRAFLRQRLGISVRTDLDEIADELPVELDGLERWGIGQRILEARLAGVDIVTARRAEIARGALPPGLLGKPILEDVSKVVSYLVTETESVAPAGSARDPLDVRLTLPGGRLLSGTVSGVSGDVLLSTTFSRVAAKHRLAAWVRLLAATAAHPERALSAVTIGRGQGRDDVRTALIGPLGASPAERQERALAALGRLLVLFDRGLREPLPLYCETSARYAAAALAGQDPIAEAQTGWKSGFERDREDREPEHQLVLGGEAPLEQLLEAPPAPEESGPDWDEREQTRLGRLAVRLWRDLLAVEVVRAR